MRAGAFRFAFAVILILPGFQAQAALFDCPTAFAKLTKAFQQWRIGPEAPPALKTPELVFSSENPPEMRREFLGRLANSQTITTPVSKRSLQSMARWKQYSESFQVTTKTNILNSSSVYADAIRRGHPHITFLERMGYHFKTGAQGELLDVDVPPLETLIKNYEMRMREHVAAGSIKPDDVLIPMRAFKRGDDVVFIRYGDEIPDGMIPYERILSTKDFAVIAQHKGFVISETKPGIIYSDLHSALEHDLGHLSSYDEFPKFQKEITKFNSSYAKDSFKRQRDRSSYINEFLEGVGTQNRPRLADIFKRHRLEVRAWRHGIPAKVAEYRFALRFKSEAQIRSLLQELETDWFRLVSKPGAAVRDIADQEFYRQIKDYDGSDRARLSLWPHALARESTFDNRLINIRKSAKIDKDQVAQLLTALDNTSYFQFDEVVRQSMQPEIERSSPLYIFLCINQLRSSSDTPAFCR